jgi:hypothetical protein
MIHKKLQPYSPLKRAISGRSPILIRRRAFFFLDTFFLKSATGPRYRLPRIDPEHFACKVYNDTREEKGSNHTSPVLKLTRIFSH